MSENQQQTESQKFNREIFTTKAKKILGKPCKYNVMYCAGAAVLCVLLMLVLGKESDLGNDLWANIRSSFDVVPLNDMVKDIEAEEKISTATIFFLTMVQFSFIDNFISRYAKSGPVLNFLLSMVGGGFVQVILSKPYTIEYSYMEWGAVVLTPFVVILLLAFALDYCIGRIYLATGVMVHKSFLYRFFGSSPIRVAWRTMVCFCIFAGLMDTLVNLLANFHIEQVYFWIAPAAGLLLNRLSGKITDKIFRNKSTYRSDLVCAVIAVVILLYQLWIIFT